MWAKHSCAHTTISESCRSCACGIIMDPLLFVSSPALLCCDWLKHVFWPFKVFVWQSSMWTKKQAKSVQAPPTVNIKKHLLPHNDPLYTNKTHYWLKLTVRNPKIKMWDHCIFDRAILSEDNIWVSLCVFILLRRTCTLSLLFVLTIKSLMSE